MNKLILLLLLTSSFAFASGISHKSVCTPVLKADQLPTLTILTLSTNAPRGPVYTQNLLTVDKLGPFKELSSGKYSQDIELTFDAVTTPAGESLPNVYFVSLRPGQTAITKFTYKLYSCQ